MRKKRHPESKEPGTTTGLSYTDAFVKRIADLLHEKLTAENYETTFRTIVDQCEGSYDLNRAGAAAMKLAESDKRGSETLELCCKMGGDLFRMQCEAERTSGRTTIFTEFYNSATDAYLDGGHMNQALAVTFEHSYWLITNALYREEAGRQKYLGLSVKAFDEVMRRSTGDIALFVHQQQEGRTKAADALQDVKPPAHLASVKDPDRLRSDAQTYGELIAFLEHNCNACDVAAYFAGEVAAVLEAVLPELAREYAALATELKRRHAALLEEHAVS
jgi:hypothetical protein